MVYRYGLGVRVIRSRFPRSKLREDFDYNLWSKILGRYVSPKSGRVNYSALRKRRELLEEFVGMLAVFGPESTPSLFSTKMERMAYWINAYNALVLFAVLEYFPVGTILDIRSGFLCCSSSDYHLHSAQRAKERKKRRKQRERQREWRRRHKENGKASGHGASSQQHHGQRIESGTKGIGGGIHIKYNQKRHQLLIEDRDNDQIICILNEKKREKMRREKKAKKAQRAESEQRLKRSYWFFEALRFEVDGQLYSLREIERDIIVSRFGDHDARVLCCLNKGCAGSPKLCNKPFEAHLLNQQLNEQNRLLCSGAVKAKDLSLIGRNICVSSIFRHFKGQYVKYAKKNQWIISNRHNSIDHDNGALLGYIYHFADKEMRNKLSHPIISGHCIKYIEFDWRLSIHRNKQSVKLKAERKADRSSVGRAFDGANHRDKGIKCI